MTKSALKGFLKVTKMFQKYPEWIFYIITVLFLCNIIEN